MLIIMAAIALNYVSRKTTNLLVILPALKLETLYAYRDGKIKKNTVQLVSIFLFFIFKYNIKNKIYRKCTFVYKLYYKAQVVCVDTYIIKRRLPIKYTDVKSNDGEHLIAPCIMKVVCVQFTITSAFFNLYFCTI